MLPASCLISVIVVIFIQSKNTNAHVNLTANPGELCNRECKVDEKPRICYFEFHLENYQAMGAACGDCEKGENKDCYKQGCLPADGVEKGVLSINRQIPGPFIQVCQNDLIVVDVINQMSGSSTTIHWHGIHQNETPYMDGVPFITQCPIDDSTTFRYAFNATECGTFFYHSHAGIQRADGITGPLIIRPPKERDPNKDCYDYDLDIIQIDDWLHNMAEMFKRGLPSRPNGLLPDNVLINGHGRYRNPKTGNQTITPLQVYQVKPNKRYRFRLIAALSTACPVKFQVENHTLEVIATDSNDVEPRKIDTLCVFAGERYDFVINANQAPGDYWIRCRLIGPCDGLEIEQFAILRYIGSLQVDREIPPFNETYPNGTTLNFPNTICFNGNSSDICVTELSASEPDIELLNASDSLKVFLPFANYPIPNEQVFAKNKYNNFIVPYGNTTQMGGMGCIQFKAPPIPLLTQRDNITEDMLCKSHFPMECNSTNLRTCVHLIKVPCGFVVIVDIIFFDDSWRTKSDDMYHPMHVHGCSFMVIYIGRFSYIDRKVVEEITKNNMTRPHHTPPFKDTIAVPSKGIVIIRFRATNCGFWFIHCHFDFHMSNGMSAVLQVGEHNEMVKTPLNFPKCGNYKPDINDGSWNNPDDAIDD